VREKKKGKGSGRKLVCCKNNQIATKKGSRKVLGDEGVEEKVAVGWEGHWGKIKGVERKKKKKKQKINCSARKEERSQEKKRGRGGGC